LSFSNRYYQILNNPNIVWQNISFKPLEVSFALEDSDSNGVLDITSTDHVREKDPRLESFEKRIARIIIDLSLHWSLEVGTCARI
jgi:hypothetical protein